MRRSLCVGTARARVCPRGTNVATRAPLPSLRGHPQSWDNPLSSRIKPRLAPGLTESSTAELDPIMQAERPILPELHDQGQEAIAGPIRRSRNGTSHEFRTVERNRPLEGVGRLERSGRLAQAPTEHWRPPVAARLSRRTRPAHLDRAIRKHPIFGGLHHRYARIFSEATGLSPAFPAICVINA